MQAVYENHQFYSPVTNWKSKNKNRRRQQILSVNSQKKNVKSSEIKTTKYPKSPKYPKSETTPKSEVAPKVEITPKSEVTPKVEITPKNQVTSKSEIKSPKSPNDDLVFPSRSHSLNSKFAKVSPKATSNPITIPSSNKKVPQMASSDQSITTEIGFSSFSHGNSFAPKSILTSTPNTNPSNTLLFKKDPTVLPIPKRGNSSLVNLFNNNKSIKEKGRVNLPKINTTNLSNISTSLDSCTLIDSANSESSSFFNYRKNLISPKMAANTTPEFANSSVITNCLSPSDTSNNSNIVSGNQTGHDIIDHESSVATLVQSPSLGETSYLSMSNDQLFKLLPKKIVRAVDNYNAQNVTTEISYKKGDFFFVISENETYYFVTNPSTKQSGYVSKFSFEQVDNFSKSLKFTKGTRNLSPIAEREDNKLIKEQTSINDRIMTACITEDIISRSSQHKFPIEITKIDGTVAVLYRSYNDICQLHDSLLEYFQEDAGSNRQERILPFLPSHDAIFNHPSKSPRHILSNYLQMLTKLPNYIQFSYPFDEFFNLRQDDILSSIYVVNQLNFFEESDDLLCDIHSTIKVKIIVEDKISGHQEVNILRVDPDVEYFDLFDTLEERFDKTFTNIYYQNEAGVKVKIFGDKDLNLFFNSNNLSYVLWAQ